MRKITLRNARAIQASLRWRIVCARLRDKMHTRLCDCVISKEKRARTEKTPNKLLVRSQRVSVPPIGIILQLQRLLQQHIETQRVHACITILCAPRVYFQSILISYNIYG